MRLLILVAAALALSACKQNIELPSIISPYRIDIQQGNVVTQEMVSKLKVGMTRSQVRFVLGSPLVTDMFHSDRWDYVYMMQKQGKPEERRRLTVIFNGDTLSTLEGDVVVSDKIEPPPVPKAPTTVIISTDPKPVPAKPAPKPEAAKPALKPPGSVTPAPQPESTVTPAPPAIKPAPVEQPVKPKAATEDLKPSAGTSGDKPAASKPVAGQSEEVKADAANAGTAETSKPEAAKLEPANTDAAKGDPAKADAGAADDKKEPPKRGMFGRMLDKIGF